MAEAAKDSIGLENALNWEKAIKAATLCMVVALGNVIAGFSLGDMTDEVLAWFD